MKRLCQIVALLTLLLTCAAPVMACMNPARSMTDQELDCCRMMHGQCGQSSMPASHDCCHKAPAASQIAVLTANAVTIHPPPLVAYSTIEVLLSPEVVSHAWVARPDASPPRRAKPVLSQLRL